MEKNSKKEMVQETARKNKKAGKKPVSPVDKVDFLLQLNKLQGTLLLQLRKEV